MTIAKAGIHASLNARCSVLAAANPVYGQYDRQRSPQANIGLPDSLLSRFDLLFVVLDTLDPSFDRTLSEHVIRSHQYRRPGTIMEPEPLNQVSSVSLEDAADASKVTLVWQRGGRGSDSSFGDGREGDVLTKDFMRKYIHYAKSRREPDLTEGAMEQISTEYAKMRSKQTKRNLPVTARTLETIIRLSTASAKCRLSSSVEERDVTAGVELLNFVLYHDISGHNEDVSNDRKRPREAEEIFPQRALLHGANARVRHFLSQQQLAGTTEISVESLLQQLNENPDFDADPIDMGGLTAILEELNVENRVRLSSLCITATLYNLFICR